MLTRLKVSGFKNLVDVDVRFGPFTCIAGANAVGKSNLFDAIRFLSMLADKRLHDAAMSLRGGRATDIKNLFHRVGDMRDGTMRFEAEMIVPKEGIDDLGQSARAGATFLRYTVEIGLREGASENDRTHGLEVRHEELVGIDEADAEGHLWFPHTQEWRESVVTTKQAADYISTEHRVNESAAINLHPGDSGNGEKTRIVYASHAPRTVLSAVNSTEFSAVLLARREMQSWRLLHLEPSALREPDDFDAPTRLGEDGSHLPATLSHLAESFANYPTELGLDEDAVYAQVANRLADLVGFRSLWIDRDDKRELLTLMVSERDGTFHTARSLSDGTLRFLALATLPVDPDTTDLLCIEEPENGIAPQKIPALLRLLEDYAVDPTLPASLDNPLRQVIITTHSPNVVLQVPEESLLVAESREMVAGDKRFARAVFSGLSHTWRQTQAPEPQIVRNINLGTVLEYLNPIEMPVTSSSAYGANGTGTSRLVSGRRVIDRDDVQKYWPYKGEG